MRALLVSSLGAAICAGALFACSSSSSGASPSDAGGDHTAVALEAGPDVIVDPQNCVAPGTPNNSQGIGGYCSPGGGQCAQDGGDAGQTFCTADFGSIVPAHAWFCTALCSLDGGANVCGTPGPPCVNNSQGYPACLPTTCHSFLGDGG